MLLKLKMTGQTFSFPFTNRPGLLTDVFQIPNNLEPSLLDAIY